MSKVSVDRRQGPKGSLRLTASSLRASRDSKTALDTSLDGRQETSRRASVTRFTSAVRYPTMRHEPIFLLASRQRRHRYRPRYYHNTDRSKSGRSDEKKSNRRGPPLAFRSRCPWRISRSPGIAPATSQGCWAPTVPTSAMRHCRCQTANGDITPLASR